MSRRDLIDPELRAPLDALLAAMPGGFNAIPDIVARRAAAAQLLGSIEVPPNPNVTAEDRVIPGPDGEPDITVRIYRPVAAAGPLPGIYFIHGGGMILGSVEGEDAGATLGLRPGRRRGRLRRVPARPRAPASGPGRGLLRRPGLDRAPRGGTRHRPGPAGHLRRQRRAAA